jgi:hypothetical protein
VTLLGGGIGGGEGAGGGKMPYEFMVPLPYQLFFFFFFGGTKV